MQFQGEEKYLQEKTPREKKFHYKVNAKNSLNRSRLHVIPQKTSTSFSDNTKNLINEAQKSQMLTKIFLNFLLRAASGTKDKSNLKSWKYFSKFAPKNPRTCSFPLNCTAEIRSGKKNWECSCFWSDHKCMQRTFLLAVKLLPALW